LTPPPAGSVSRSLLERRSVFLAGVSCFCLLGLARVLRGYAGPDTGFLLDEAARVLDGARLYLDLVEMNPPLTVLLNLAAVLLARATGLPVIPVYQVACAVAVLLLLLLAGWLLRRLLPGDTVRRRAMALTLAFVFFCLVGQDFGEREHLVLALAVPYLLLAAARAAGREVPAPAAALIGILAGCAFAMKPHFVLLWPAVLAFLVVARRVPVRRLWPETAALAGFLALYGLAIVLWAPGYLDLVRLLAGPYTRFLYVPFWELLVRGPGALLAAFALLAYAAIGRRGPTPGLPGVLALGAVVCLVAGAAQQKGFSYHFYPALGLSALLLGSIVTGGGAVPRSWVDRVYRVLAIGVMATLVVVGCGRTALLALRPDRDPEQVQMERLLPLVRERAAGQSVYVMSYNISSAFPLINYAGARSASRFPQLWILAAAYMEQLRGSGPLRYRAPAEMTPSERFLNLAVYEDLRDQRPRLLVVLQHARDLPSNGFRRLDYVGYFGRDPRIARELARYQRIADLGDFVVYERLGEGAARTGPAPAVRPGTQDILQPRVSRVAGIPKGATSLLLAAAVFLLSVTLAARAEKVRTA
jgi:hypothetical protein